MDRLGDLDRWARSFERHLRAENKSPKTVATYGEAVTQLRVHLPGLGVFRASEITREHVMDFIAHLVETRAPATASNRFRALQAFVKWLVEEDYREGSPMVKMRPPVIPEQPVEPFSVPDVKALLSTCKTGSFEDRRDEAIIRLLPDAGLRRGELLGMRCPDVRQALQPGWARDENDGGSLSSCPRTGLRLLSAPCRRAWPRTAHGPERLTPRPVQRLLVSVS